MDAGEQAEDLPETVPGQPDDFPDAQGPCEEPALPDTLPDLDYPDYDEAINETAAPQVTETAVPDVTTETAVPDVTTEMAVPDVTTETATPTAVINEKALPGDARDDRDDVSVATTMSLGSPWEKEIYKYVRQQDGTYIKYVRDECKALAIARGWDLGPVAVGAPCKGPHNSNDMPPPPVPVKLRTNAAAAPTVPAPVSEAAAAPAAGQAAAEQSPSAQPAPKAQDRTLELAGLQALMQAQHRREQEAVGKEIEKVQQQVLLANELPPQPKVDQSLEISWSTHKKEGMRLKRLMEDSAEGQKM